MEELRIIRIRFYDKLGRIAENGKFAYVTFHIGKDEKPQEGDLLVQVTNLKGIPILVAKFMKGEFLSAFRRPVDIKNLDELKSMFNVPDSIVEEIRKVCREKGIDWI
jgi:hypothetical protein